MLRMLSRSPLGRLAQRYLDLYNATDLDAWSELLHPDVHVVGEAGTARGRDRARRLAAGTMRAFPGLRAQLLRVVAESATTIVVEYELVNPAPECCNWALEGTWCDHYEIADGLIAEVRNYYLPGNVDRTDGGALPSRTETARLAEERQALQRVAGLVAQRVSPERLFGAVGNEVGRLVGADITALMRYENEDEVTVLSISGRPDEGPVLVGQRRPLDGRLRAVRDGGRARRIGPTDLVEGGPFVAEARLLGVGHFVLVPVAVEGRVWGIVVAAAAAERPFSDDTEARIAGFTELVGTAIANAQTRDVLRRLLDEQRALRSVATLVASRESPQRIFEEAGRQATRLLGTEPMVLMRREDDRRVAIVSASASAADLVGFDVEPGEGVANTVIATGRPSRIDDYRDPTVRARPTSRMALDHGVVASVGAPILVGGSVWGLLMALSRTGPLPPGTEGRLGQLAELVAMAIANADSRRELTSSRARVAAAADETRRRIRRDLHDGAQQRLVHTTIALQMATRALRDEGIVAGQVVELVNEALENAQRATRELRDLVHGIMPEPLTVGGLRAGVRSLIRQIDLPVHVEIPTERFPAPLETTAYFVIAESLTNAVKHAAAGEVSVVAARQDDALTIEVRDDGVGGADCSRGTGMVGLADRVAVMGGAMSVTSPVGGGTVIAVRLPLAGETGERPAGVAPAV
jgi:signal transduction histidine kinase/ketosteroid isomerase-like protein